jgi:hypothetical protein
MELHMTITTNERAVLLALVDNHFHDGNQGEDEKCGQWLWANCINDSTSPSGIDGKALSGVVSNLVQKGLVVTDGNKGREACVRLTPSGYRAVVS